MKHTRIALFAALVLGAPAWGQEPGQEPGQGSAPKKKLPEELVRFDLDQDGRLDQEEALAARDVIRELQTRRKAAEDAKKAPAQDGSGVPEAYRQFDKNGNGKLDPDEQAALRKFFAFKNEKKAKRAAGDPTVDAPAKATPDTPVPTTADEPVAASDGEGAGSTYARDALARFDYDQDGKLNDLEAADARKAFEKEKAKGPAAVRNDRASRADAAATRGDDPAPAAGVPEAYRRFDTNENGRLDPDEQKEVQRHFQAQRGAKRAQAPAAGDAPAPEGPAGEEGDDAGTAYNREILSRFDYNQDGKLNAEEAAAAREAHRKTQAKTTPEPGDGDRGTVERPAAEQAEGGIPEIYREFDLDKNGELGDRERERMRQFFEAKSKKKNARRDDGAAEPATETDADGGSEGTEYNRDILARFDYDQDGKLNDEEAADAREAYGKIQAGLEKNKERKDKADSRRGDPTKRRRASANRGAEDGARRHQRAQSEQQRRRRATQQEGLRRRLRSSGTRRPTPQPKSSGDRSKAKAPPKRGGGRR